MAEIHGSVPQGVTPIDDTLRIHVDSNARPVRSSHTGSITSLAISSDGKWLASGSDEASVMLWSINGEYPIWTHTSGNTVPWDLSFSPDSLCLASPWGEGSAILLETYTGNVLLDLSEHEYTSQSTHTIRWLPQDTKFACGSDRQVALWDSQTLEMVYEYSLPGRWSKDIITFMVVSPDGRRIVCGSTRYCEVLDARTGRPHHELHPPHAMSWSNAAAFSPDSERVATAIDDGSILVWEVRTGELLHTLRAHRAPIWSVAFFSDGTRIMTASGDATVKISNSRTGEAVALLEGHVGSVTAACISPSGTLIASASSDCTVRLWSTSSGSCIAVYTEHIEAVTCVLFSPDGRYLVSGSDDGALYIRDLDHVPLS